MQGESRRSVSVPMVAAALAIAYLVAVAVGPWALAAVTVAAAVAGCALALARRPTSRLRAALAAIALWLAAGLGGALLLRGHPMSGLVWVLFVVYVLPLPAVPYLYARTFDDPDKQGKGKREKGKGTTRLTRGRARRLASLFLPEEQVKGKREAGKGTTGAAQGRARRSSSLFPFPSSLFPPTSRHGQAQGSGPESAPAPGDTR